MALSPIQGVGHELDHEELGELAAQASLLNKMRAAVLGANDGVVSTAGMVMGVAGATTDSFAILIAGIAGLTAGALSMATGEYVSVSAQRDAEQVMGMHHKLQVNPMAAAIASMLSFILGALVPLLAMVLTPPTVRITATVSAVLVTLVLTGWLSARAGSASVPRAILRNIAGGVIAMGVTYGIGTLVGMQLG